MRKYATTTAEINTQLRVSGLLNISYSLTLRNLAASTTAVEKARFPPVTVFTNLGLNLPAPLVSKPVLVNERLNGRQLPVIRGVTHGTAMHPAASLSPWLAKKTAAVDLARGRVAEVNRRHRVRRFPSDEALHLAPVQVPSALFRCKVAVMGVVNPLLVPYGVDGDSMVAPVHPLIGPRGFEAWGRRGMRVLAVLVCIKVASKHPVLGTCLDFKPHLPTSPLCYAP